MHPATTKPIHGAPKPKEGTGPYGSPTPPIPCDLKPGDEVTYTNDYGVKFGPRKVRGFASSDHMLFQWGRFVYIETDCWWSPVSPESLKLCQSNAGATP